MADFGQKGTTDIQSFLILSGYAVPGTSERRDGLKVLKPACSSTKKRTNAVLRYKAHIAVGQKA